MPSGTVTAKLVRYSKRLIERYDSNGDGRLDEAEWSSMRGRPAIADSNGDGQITVDEFARYAANYGSGRRILLSTRREPVAQSTPTSLRPDADGTGAADTDQIVVKRRRDLKYFAPLPKQVQSWFVERDADGDAQLTLVEFSPKLRSAEVAEFKSYDLNGDGLLTAAEAVRAGSRPRNEGSATGKTATPSSP